MAMALSEAGERSGLLPLHSDRSPENPLQGRLGGLSASRATAEGS